MSTAVAYAEDLVLVKGQPQLGLVESCPSCGGDLPAGTVKATCRACVEESITTADGWWERSTDFSRTTFPTGATYARPDAVPEGACFTWNNVTYGATHNNVASVRMPNGTWRFLYGGKNELGESNLTWANAEIEFLAAGGEWLPPAESEYVELEPDDPDSDKNGWYELERERRTRENGLNARIDRAIGWVDSWCRAPKKGQVSPEYADIQALKARWIALRLP